MPCPAQGTRCIAKAFAEAKNKGQLDAMIAGMKPAKTDEVAPPEKVCPKLAEFYKAVMVPLWESTVVNGTAKRYASSFRNHVESALGQVHYPISRAIKSEIS